MFPEYQSLELEVEGRSLKGFCLRISDEFYETYAVVLEGYQSFSIWLDASKERWCASKYANIEPTVLEKIMFMLPGLDSFVSLSPKS
ncbi:MAG: hypothetical protein EOO00_06685 [Chitinophagaceae bacterium]|nr:MAG: hypothetical protein EOO00_06685 [Chitinophagaceae bacterium]